MFFKLKALLIAITLLLVVLHGNLFAATQQTVVIYTAVDQIFSEPILKDFEKKTGIRVKAIYDVEAAKTTGLVNRLIAEKSNPQCDVFWNNEIVKSIMLKQKDILTPYASPSAKDIPDQFKDKGHYWTGFAARARVLVVNRTLFTQGKYPQSIFDLTKPEYAGKTAIANPLFGTTATHVAALFSYLGPDKAKQLFLGLKKNSIKILNGNSIVKDNVGAGQQWVGFTDTDDVNVGIEAHLPIDAIYPDKQGLGTLLIPNTISLIKNSPHPENGRKLINYLLSKEVESRLAFCESVQMPVRKEVKTPQDFVTIDQIKAMPVDYQEMYQMQQQSVKFVQDIFIR